MSFLSDLFGTTAANASTQAGQIGQAGAREAIGVNKDLIQQARNDLQPFTDAGVNALPGLTGLVQDQNQQKDFIQNNPFFTSLANDAQQRIFNNQAAKGKIGSGETAKALQNSLILLGNDLRNQSVGERLNLANLGRGASRDQAFVSTAGGRNIGELITQGANAEAAGTVGAANALGQGSSQVLQGALGLGNLVTGGQGIGGLAGLGGSAIASGGDLASAVGNTGAVTTPLPTGGTNPLTALPSPIPDLGAIPGSIGPGGTLIPGVGISDTVVGGGGTFGAGPSGTVSPAGLNSGDALSSIPNPFSGLFGVGTPTLPAVGSPAAGALGASGAGAATGAPAGFTLGSAAIVAAPFAVLGGLIAGSFAKKAQQRKIIDGLTTQIQNSPATIINGEPRFAFKDSKGNVFFASQLARDKPKKGQARAISNVFNPRTGEFGQFHAEVGFISNAKLAEIAKGNARGKILDRGGNDPNMQPERDRQGVLIDQGIQTLTDFRDGN